MDTIAFTDRTDVCVYRDGKIMRRASKFIASYKDNLRRAKNASAWKREGTGAQFLNESEKYSYEEEPNVCLNGIAFTDRPNTLAYAFTVGESSGIYYKDFSVPESKNDEIHVIHSDSLSFESLSCNKKDGTMLATIRKNNGADAAIARFEKDGDYTLLTDGDSLDENPSYTAHGEILFDTAGVGRDGSGNFVSYSESEIYSVDPLTLQMEQRAAQKGCSYIKPKTDARGNLYAVRRPLPRKEKRNILLEIVLIPVRIIEGIVGFTQAFVRIFAQKPLVDSEKKRSNRSGNDVVSMEKAPKYTVIDGMPLDPEWETKQNERRKDGEITGFIPPDWQLVKFTPEGEIVLKKGVCDYAFGEDGIYATDGRHVHCTSYDGKKSKKIFDAGFCLHLDVK